MEKKHTYISRMLTSYWASRLGGPRFRRVSPRVPVSSFMMTRWLRSSKITLFQIQAQWGKARIFLFSQTFLGSPWLNRLGQVPISELVPMGKSMACFDGPGKHHVLHTWNRDSHPDLRAYFPSKYWEVENSFLKASKPKSSYLLSFIKGGAFCTSPLTLLYIFCLFCLLILV